MPIHGEQIELNPIFVACFSHELISTCILFAILLLYKLSLFLVQLSSTITQLLITKIETLAVHTFVTIDIKEDGIQGGCENGWFSFSGSHIQKGVVNYGSCYNNWLHRDCWNLKSSPPSPSKPAHLLDNVW